MIFLSAGHHNSDPGAVAHGVQENHVTMQLRDLVAHALLVLPPYGIKFVLDKDFETNQQYQARIKTGNGSVVCDLHFNSGAESSTGTETFYADDAIPAEIEMAKEIAVMGAEVLGIRNRGAKPESQSNRGRLGILRESGLAVLIEVCFLSNKPEMDKYYAIKQDYATRLAAILKKYDDLIA